MKLGPTLVAALLLPVCAWPAALRPQPALAQVPTPQRGPMVNAPLLTTFAEAYLDISEINAERDARIRALRNRAEVERVEQQADSARQAALAKRRMTADEYAAMDELIGADAEVRQEFESILARVRQERETADTLDAQPPRDPGPR